MILRLGPDESEAALLEPHVGDFDIHREADERLGDGRRRGRGR